MKNKVIILVLVMLLALGALFTTFTTEGNADSATCHWCPDCEMYTALEYCSGCLKQQYSENCPYDLTCSIFTNVYWTNARCQVCDKVITAVGYHDENIHHSNCIGRDEYLCPY